ncbi:CDP-glucose 4,6-dehydratase [Desulfovibrio psychrotolerans]|uniref:CDP-glucose 4,6-dehydratase n=1 Tax=Desulfovibrio psychrotolerans TaxID=415242 RepID=A0A7J0BY78_9BACT|nr:CDP-glucose 4,6-dehydratase [Desulfovibrio psychrotolerans]GFM38132.1 CDP-glucose 4,6-dehydratase [Desulfovibrio psychrotolerans]
MTVFGGIYSGKKVLVTGHTGFKGSWLTAWLLSLGAEVAGYSLDVPTSPANFEVLELGRRITHIQGDIRDRAALTKAVQDFAPDAIFHLAAQALVRESYREPAYTIEANAMGTLNVMEAVRLTPSVQALVLITSDKAYRNDEWVWGYRETDHLGGEDPYSASKGCAEIIAHSYMQSFFGNGPRSATTRAGNVIGGGDWAADRIVPDCARAWAKGEPVSIRSPWATRPWQHVLEPLSGYLWLGAKLLENAQGPFPLDKQAFNFGPAADVNNPVAEVVDALAAYWSGFSSEMDRSGCAGMKECTLLKLCCDKALSHLQWRAAMPFAETIRFTAEWYRAYYREQADMFAFTMAQIAEYTEKARAQDIAWTR